MSKLLFNTQPLVVDPDLAMLVGLNEAIVIQQVHYWIEINKKAERNFHDDRYWTYNTLKEWHQNYFPFWSFNTVRRTIRNLEEKGILLVGSFSKNPADRTKWYTINYETLDELNNEGNSTDKSVQTFENKASRPYAQNGQMPLTQSDSSQDENECSPICPNWANAYAQNGQIYLLTENNNTEINSIYPSDNLNTKQETLAYVKTLIGYDGWINSSQDLITKPWLDNIVGLLVDIFSQKTGKVRIAGTPRNVKEVKDQLARLKPGHLSYLAESLERSKPDVKNIKGYILTSLYNAPNTAVLFDSSEITHQQKKEAQKNALNNDSEFRKRFSRKI